MEIRKKSIDARKKPALYSVYTVWADCGDREEKILNRRKNRPNISRANAVTYAFSPAVFRKGSSRKQVPSPVIVGTGPAGLFCGYLLALWGLCPILLERGRPAQQRLRDVTAFWETGMLDPASNVQFGEGGAGTFSDGKLNTLVKDKDGRNRFVLETLCVSERRNISCGIKNPISERIFSSALYPVSGRKSVVWADRCALRPVWTLF